MMMKFLFAITLAFLLCGACKDDKQEYPFDGNSVKSKLSFTMKVNDGLETRAGRPLYSSQNRSEIREVNIYVFRKIGEEFLYTGKSLSTQGVNVRSEWEEDLERGTYKFLAVGFPEGWQEVFTSPALEVGVTRVEDVVLALKEGKNPSEIFSGSCEVAVVYDGMVHVNLSLRRLMVGVFAYFKNIPAKIDGTVVKSVIVKGGGKNTALNLLTGEASGYSNERYDLINIDLSSAGNDGSVYTCPGTESEAEYTKVPNSWLSGAFVMPVNGVEGKATLDVVLCSDAAGSNAIKNYEVKYVFNEGGVSESDAKKDFDLSANYFYGLGQKAADNSSLANDLPIDLSSAETIIINSELSRLFPSFPDYGGAVAFPTAVGFGAKATGARGSKAMEVYHVTNLDASGTGSFADAVSKEGRFVVFDVAGVIDLKKSVVVLKPNQTILFQTAPGDGIELYNGRVSASGASNCIVRYMRVRTGRQVGGSDNTDACGVANGENIIFDHCSFTWGTDENFSIRTDGKGTRPRNITLQNSIIGQGCMNHSAGGLIETNDSEGITIFRNLLIDNGTRNFKVKGLNQYVNNVIYNWGKGAAYNMGGESSGHSNTVIENNYFIKGPCWVWRNTPVAEVDPAIIGTDKCVPAGSDGKYYEVLAQENPTRPFTGGNEEFSTYCVGNYYDYDLDGSLNGEEITQANWAEYCSGNPAFVGSRPAEHDDINLKISATEAYQWVVKNVGATLPARDKVDGFMIEELVSLGKKGTIFRNQRQMLEYPLANTWQNINTSGVKPLDTDNDGMSDDFEDYYGLDKNDPSDAVVVTSNGYTNLENYVFIKLENLIK